jgi:HSP20 family protein
MIGLLTTNNFRRPSFDVPEMEQIMHNVLKHAFEGGNFYANDVFSTSMVEVLDKDILVTVPVPGRKAEDIELEIVDKTLTIKVKKCSCNNEEGKGRYVSKERNCEEFEESLRLPMAVQAAKATAKVVDGVLTVSIPRLDADIPKSCVIKVN